MAKNGFFANSTRRTGNALTLAKGFKKQFLQCKFTRTLQLVLDWFAGILRAGDP